MAGGEGTRLRPLTSNQPKPMVPIVGKPCMEHILELLKQHGLEEVIVTVAFMPQAIRSYFGNGDTLGMSIEYSVEESPLGTAGSVRLASDRLEETFLVISGDALCDVDLTDLIRAHREKEAAVTIGLKSVENPARVRDRRHRRGGPRRALPREAVLEPGLLGHDQHRHLRARARGAAPHPDRPAVRLLEGALPAPARDGPADVRLRLRGLLAGHREPRPVPAGELRCARRARTPEHPGDPPARQHLARGRGGGGRPRRDRGPGPARQLLPHRPGRVRRPLLGAGLERHAAGARPHRAFRRRRRDAHRPQRAGRGSRRRTRHATSGPTLTSRRARRSATR